ncbi:hypothetical protein Ancab_015388 [Ancistrocladus abbreviatus]
MGTTRGLDLYSWIPAWEDIASTAVVLDLWVIIEQIYGSDVVFADRSGLKYVLMSDSRKNEGQRIIVDNQPFASMTDSQNRTCILSLVVWFPGSRSNSIIGWMVMGFYKLTMESETSWTGLQAYTNRSVAGFTNTVSEVVYDSSSSEGGTCNSASGFFYEHHEETNAVCINFVLPDDLLEQVLSLLPIASIARAGCVCRKWNETVHSRAFIKKVSRTTSQKPWYFMFTRPNKPFGHVYDPTLLKWYPFQIPHIEPENYLIASSSGLLCFTPNSNMRELYVCNPITKTCRKLEQPTCPEYPLHSALAITLNEPSSHYSYTVGIVRSTQAHAENLVWDVAIDVYSSDRLKWESPVKFTSQWWRGGGNSVIRNGVLYFVVYLSRRPEFAKVHFGLLAYNLSSQSFNFKVEDHLILAPCHLTCMRIMNLKDELVMVGGIEKLGRQGIIKGIGIWSLKGREWVEVSRMPHKFFKGCGEFDDVFGSSGSDKIIYIQSYGSPALLMFTMNSKQWKWSQKCPVTKRFHSQLFSFILDNKSVGGSFENATFYVVRVS